MSPLGSEHTTGLGSGESVFTTRGVKRNQQRSKALVGASRDGKIRDDAQE